MTGKEIRHFRESVGLSTAQLGELLHGLPKGIVEGWEKGRYLQSPAVDAMLRTLSDADERERRALRAGFVLPPLPGTLPAESSDPAKSSDSAELSTAAESSGSGGGSATAGAPEPDHESGRVQN